MGIVRDTGIKTLLVATVRGGTLIQITIMEGSIAVRQVYLLS